MLPFAMPLDVWENHQPGEEWSVYGDGKLKDSSGNVIPGNWGTLDIGSSANSTADINDQILDGLDSQLLQLSGSLGPDALDVLNGCFQCKLVHVEVTFQDALKSGACHPIPSR